LPSPYDTPLAAAFDGVRGPEADLQALSWRSQIAQRMFGLGGDAMRIAGRYRLGREIGRGGMGIVCQARDERLGRDVAIKLARPQCWTTEDRARLRNEARALAALSHPNVVAVYDVGLHEGNVFIAMELVAGSSLRAWLGERSRDADAIIDVMVAAGRALAAAHEARIVHRDFKPDNLLIGTDGRARVVDFGLAVAIGEVTTPHERRSGAMTGSEDASVAGTPLYLPPEARAGAAVDAFGDQFAYCATFREALDGMHPFCHRGREHALESIAKGDIGDRPAGSRAPRWLTAILDRGLSPTPEQRWPSMTALLRAIESRRARTRRGIAFVGAGIVVALAAAAFADDDPACSGGEASMGVVWSDARAEALRARIDPDASSHAAAAWERVESGMAAFSSAWVQARRDACESARPDRASPDRASPDRAPPEDVDATVACLDDDLRDADALIEALANAPDPARYAAEAIADLASPSTCVDRIARDEAPPPGADEIAIASTVDDLLARSRGADAAGDYPAALALAREAVELSTPMHHAPTHGAALLQLGTALELTGNFADAADRTEQALLVAIGAEDDRLAARAATFLVFILGERLGRTDDAEAFVRHAEVALARIDHPAELELDHISNTAALRRAQGRLEESADGHARALAGRRELHGDRSLRVAVAAHNYALVLFELGRFDEALALAREAIETREALIGSEHPLVASTRLAVGASLVRVGRVDEGLEHFERAVAISQASLGPTHQQTLAASANYGIALRMAGDVERSVEVLTATREALRAQPDGDHPLLATVITGLGGGLLELGRHDEARVVLEEALAIFERIHGGRDPGTAAVLGNLGNLYLATGDHARARDNFEKALELLAPLGPAHPHAQQAAAGLEQARSKLAQSELD
jgi:tetratricopeptide (TPR) repeat protein/predicted Ser/Thr protein kinase